MFAHTLLLPAKRPFDAVIKESEIGQRTRIEPVRPSSQIVRNGDDGATGDDRLLTPPVEEIHIRAYPVPVHYDVVVGKQQELSKERG